MFNYIQKSDSPAQVVGSFNMDKNADFKSSCRYLYESMGAQHIHPVRDIQTILQDSVLREAYNNALLSDVKTSTGDEYYDTMAIKLEQLINNSSMETLRESSVGVVSPVVGLTLPILKKSYIEGHSKDIVPVEVPTKPIVKVAFERKFLKDAQGNKHYIPEVFYTDAYKGIMAKARGTELKKDWYPAGGGTLPIHEFNLITENGGSMEKRDSLAYDFGISAVKMEVDGVQKEIVQDITVSLEGDHTFTSRVTALDSHGAQVVDILMGHVDFYTGNVSVSSTNGKIKKVQFKGHLSNVNNVNTIEIDRERQIMDWNIPDGAKINTGLTTEMIKDYNALFDVDITAEMIADMATVLTQDEDSMILDFLNNSFDSWNGKNDEFLGYNEGFTRKGFFSCEPTVNKMVTQSAWIETELKFNLNRFIDELKVLLKNQDIMFVVYGHPNNITLIQDNVRWVIDEDSTIGGIQLDYKFGVMTANKNRIRVLSTMKCPRERGLRVVAYSTNQEVITFKHLKYSMTIDNNYRNPLTPFTPNIMATSRYLTKEVLPVQGEFILIDNMFSLKPQAPLGKTAAPVFNPASGALTGAKQVTLTCSTAGAKIHYTTDGSAPDATKPFVMSGGKVTISANCTLKAIAYAPNYTKSDVTSAAFTV